MPELCPAQLSPPIQYEKDREQWGGSCSRSRSSSYSFLLHWEAKKHVAHYIKIIV